MSSAGGDRHRRCRWLGSTTTTRVTSGAAPGAGSGRERGAVAVELVLIVPAIMLFVGLFAYGYRLWAARAAVLSAAESAARAATLAHDASQARTLAESAAASNLDTLGVHCSRRSIEADVSALTLPAGRPGVVNVSVHCVVSMSDLLVPGAPGSVTIDRSASEATNRFTERRP